LFFAQNRKDTKRNIKMGKLKSAGRSQKAEAKGSKKSEKIGKLAASSEQSVAAK
jgi:hypothetical protein